MAINSLNDYHTDPTLNTDIAGSDINVGCSPVDVGIFMRTVMAQIAYAVQGSGGAIPLTWHVQESTFGGDPNFKATVSGASNVYQMKPLNFINSDGANTHVYTLGSLFLGEVAVAVALCGVSTNPSGTLTPGVAVSSSGQLSGYSALTSPLAIGTGNTVLAVWFQGSTGVGSITTDGSSVAYNTTSDARLKLDDGALVGSEASWTLNELTPRMYRWKSQPGEKSEPGFFAQEVYRVLPHAVVPGEGEPGADGFVPWAMDAGKMMPVVVSALQHALKRIETLSARIAVLEDK